MEQPPDPGEHFVLTSLLWAVSLLLLCAQGVVLALRARAAARTGAARWSARGRHAARNAWLATLALAAIAVLVRARTVGADGAPEIEWLPALFVLLQAGVLAWTMPSASDSVCGALGVRVGWHARRYQDLEAWRLTGDHLRWKLRGVWVACDLPAAQHDALRAELGRVCPERESAFSR